MPTTGNKAQCPDVGKSTLSSSLLDSGSATAFTSTQQTRTQAVWTSLLHTPEKEHSSETWAYSAPTVSPALLRPPSRFPKAKSKAPPHNILDGIQNRPVYLQSSYLTSLGSPEADEEGNVPSAAREPLVGSSERAAPHIVRGTPRGDHLDALWEGGPASPRVPAVAPAPPLPSPVPMLWAAQAVAGRPRPALSAPTERARRAPRALPSCTQPQDPACLPPSDSPPPRDHRHPA
ncbi:uncharacterized protein [Physeter macrocephalus]|uniref:Uncharacterized protein n=1 Tax=Physeter macrocephalus TaxID=9755 RepID=A0A2Y9S9D0_PHYMC|nr:uncharacterized protein LOC112062519 [Physeter catodon]|eukprot:XP_023972895.1 predicted GPI-anchored protein 58 [Physeter catodon]